MIARPAEATAAVLCFQSLGSERIALPRGAAMHHDVVDFSHDNRFVMNNSKGNRLFAPAGRGKRRLLTAD
ncbi:hypothetical protein AAE250_21585 [Bacteroides sp. GD17]